jgi:hypothetical protein
LVAAGSLWPCRGHLLRVCFPTFTLISLSVPQRSS